LETGLIWLWIHKNIGLKRGGNWINLALWTSEYWTQVSKATNRLVAGITSFFLDFWHQDLTDWTVCLMQCITSQQQSYSLERSMCPYRRRASPQKSFLRLCLNLIVGARV